MIDRCKSTRSYLVKCLEEATDGAEVIAFPSASKWLEAAQDHERPKVVLVCNSGHDGRDGPIVEDLSLLSDLTDVRVIVLPGAGAAAPLAARPPRHSRIATRAVPSLARCSGEQDDAFASWHRIEVVE
ncbi:hypothetical protein C2U70_25380 [Bradyrhizobium guangdongense]|uniref:hypothetical protein n=1 Tax=Bradyrhizobium guangdongense TaxID=1325090 RepID=UPI00112BB349|nr:hypothetical protein [Bradyrhizobium guangdongense]TPQ31024.1 hypothetical protein C2U70_25380 [Bradyrhizobium guangdongense]